MLDRKLVEFAATIPPERRLRKRMTKYIFKRALRGVMPDEIIDRPKHGFAVPLGRWFRGRLGNFVRELLPGLSRQPIEEDCDARMPVRCDLGSEGRADKALPHQ